MYTPQGTRDHQDKDANFHDARKQLKQGGVIKSGVFRSYGNISVRNGLLCKGERIMIPKSLQNQVMCEYHSQHHPGAENSILLIKARFYWRGMERNIKNFVAECRVCSQCKASKKQQSEMQIPKTPDCRSQLCIDIASMPLSNRGNVCFLQMVDASTKFVANIALPDQKAETLRHALWQKWFPFFGIPEYILSDQGRNVDGHVMRKMCQKLGIKKIHSSPYHPEGNGSAERSIGSVKTIIRSMCQSRGVSVENWDLLLDEATLAYNSTNNKSSN